MSFEPLLDPAAISQVTGLAKESLVDPLARLDVLCDGEFGADELPCPLGAPCVFASVPGRVELAGNHTDHQGGCVISAAIGDRMYAVARINGTALVRVAMEGFGFAELDMAESDWTIPVPEERGTSKALIRGMAAGLLAAGVAVAGFDMAVVSNVPAGYGVSSSAAFEVLTGTVLRALFTPDAFEGVALRDPVALALVGVEAERAYFGKPCGAQDQVACAAGGVVHLDFAGFPPNVEPLCGGRALGSYTACLIDTACDHSVYNDQFALIPAEMRAAAAFMGASALGEVDVRAFMQRLGEAREALGDRPVLRALHFFGENNRVARQREALEQGNVGAFLDLVKASGASSAQYLQNVSPQPVDARSSQSAAVVLALCAQLLEDRGAWRIHGGGFGGSVLVLVERGEAEAFSAQMDALLGRPACRLVEPGAPGALAVVLP